MAKKILVISPHPDDAAFSLGGFLLQNAQESILVWDVFSEQQYSICQGKYDEQEQILMEEQFAMEQLHANVILAGLPEAGMRGSQKLSDILNRTISTKEEPLLKEVKAQFAKVVEQESPDEIYLPLGSGRHIDHLIVREAVIEYLQEKQKNEAVWLYEEFPYSLNADWVEIALKDCSAYHLQKEHLDVTGMEERKAEVIRLYKSQIREREIKKIISYACSIEAEKMIERVWRYRG